ncbi:MAG: diguanylate cyclase [Spirulina sp. SIO3F2]|nr:diguanylate cyclase [Spirulina sp. SIO3F2]
MTPSSQIEKTWLSHVRHELRTPVNIILGYSEIILEDLESTELQTALLQDEAIANLKTIHDCGTQILSLVNTLSDSDYVEFNDYQVDLGHIRLKFHAPVNTILTLIDHLLTHEDLSASHADLEKIHVATNNLTQNINRIISFSVNQPNYQQPARELLTLTGTAINPVMVEETAQTITALEGEAEVVMQTVNTFKILIVDDKEANRTLLSRRLSRQGYLVDTACNGQESLEMLEHEGYDLLLLDILMPQMNGYEVLTQLKKHESWRNIPVIMISALNEIDSVVKCIQLGAEDYLTKPFNPVLLKARIGACLEKKRLRDQEILYTKQLAQAHAEILKVNHQLERMAALDGLTQVANRRSFDDVISQQWRMHCQMQQQLALIFLDVDYFKRFNDHYGHLQGDDCLRSVAQAIAQTIQRPNDLVARYGGEEFAVILPQTSLPIACAIAQTICQAVRTLAIPHKHAEMNEIVTVSLGVTSIVPTTEKSPEHLIKLADQALYKAKAQGRNQVFALTGE